MSVHLLLLILVSVTLSAVAQITLKSGMSTARVAQALADESYMAMMWVVATTPAVILGLSLYSLGAVLWLFVLARTDVSLAYPFVGLGFLLTMAFAAVFLGENLSLMRMVGTVFVVVGVVLVAHT